MRRRPAGAFRKRWRMRWKSTTRPPPPRWRWRPPAARPASRGLPAPPRRVPRGVSPNEAGLGSAGIAASAVDRADPVRQGYISMTGAFFDTIVICTVTGFAICCSGVLGTVDSAGVPVDGAALTILAFQTVLGPWGARLV